MIIDDEPDILLVTKMAIDMCGFPAETFGDPFQVLERVQDKPAGLLARAD